jgi:hypothetical protein
MTKRKPKLCPIPGCCQPIARLRLFCWDHWSALPMAVQDNIRTTWRRDGLGKAARLLPSAISLLTKREAAAAARAGE